MTTFLIRWTLRKIFRSLQLFRTAKQIRKIIRNVTIDRLQAINLWKSTSGEITFSSIAAYDVTFSTRWYNEQNPRPSFVPQKDSFHFQCAIQMSQLFTAALCRRNLFRFQRFVIKKSPRILPNAENLSPSGYCWGWNVKCYSSSRISSFYSLINPFLSYAVILSKIDDQEEENQFLKADQSRFLKVRAGSIFFLVNCFLTFDQVSRNSSVNSRLV